MIIGYADKMKFEQLKSRIEYLEAKLKNSEARVSELEKKESEVNTASTFTIDFDALRPFSIERNETRPGVWQTVVGYFVEERTVNSDLLVNNKKCKEWYLSCNLEQHEILVKEFKEWRKTRTTKL